MADRSRTPQIIVRRAGHELVFPAGSVVTIGRDPASHVRCVSPYVGRRHAELRVEGDVWTLIDLGSRRGTRHEGHRVRRVPVLAPMTVWLGDDEGGEELEIKPGQAVAGAGEDPSAEAAATDAGPAPARAVPAKGAPVSPRPATPAGPILRLEVDGRVHEVPADSDITIGRDPGCDVSLQGDLRMVSRQHLVVRLERDGWAVKDVSKHGTYLDGERISTMPLRDATTLRLGDPATGPDITVAPPAGQRGANRDAPATVTATPGVIRVRCGGRDHVFAVDRTVTIGRDPASDVVTTNPMTSRRHAILRHDGGDWVLTDAGSSRKIHLDGTAVDRTVIDGQVTVWLGPPGTGEEVTLATGPARTTVVGRLSGWTASAASIAVLVALIGVALVAGIRGPDGPGPVVPDPGDEQDAVTFDLDRLMRATVQIRPATTAEELGRTLWTGSGSIISPDGLILTNAHVAAPGAPGLGLLYHEPSEPGPERYDIFMYAGEDQPVVATYQAEEVVADGWLDLAVLRIVADAEGRPIDGDDLDLVYVEIGDSRALRRGDELWVLGFPGLTQSDSVDVQPGAFASPRRDGRVGDARGFMNVSAAIRITGGNSGGMAVDAGGRLVGVPSLAVADPAAGAHVGGLRPVHLAEDLLAAVQSGGTYDQYRYVTRPTGNERAHAVGWSRASGDDCVQEVLTSAPEGSRLAAQFRWEGIGPGQHVMFGLWLIDATGRAHLVSRSVIDDWDGPASGCLPYAAFNDDVGALPAATYRADVRLGANFDVILAEQVVTLGGEPIVEGGVEEGGGEDGEGPIRTLEAALLRLPHCREPVLEPVPDNFYVTMSRSLSIPFYQLACVYWSVHLPDQAYPTDDNGYWRSPDHVYTHLLTHVPMPDDQADAIRGAHDEYRQFLRSVTR